MQLNVWTGTKWVNIFDGNDFKNMSIDLHRVAKVVEDQVAEIDKAVKNANAAMDQANQAVDASNVNKTAVSDVEKTANEAKQNIADALKKVTNLGTQVNKNQTDIEQTKESVTLKADQTAVDDIKKTVTDNTAAVQALNNEVKSKVDSTTVNEIVDGKGYTTAETAQALIDQTANKISGTITSLKATVDKNGNLISSASDQLSNFTQALDGLQTTVKNKADQSQITQLSNQLTAKVSTEDYQTEIAALEKNLNLRVQKGDVISQINLEAGGDGLISIQNGKGKLMLDADSVVFGNKAFIPSAAITNINADKITTGTLDAAKLNVKNFSADNIVGGTLSGVVVKTGVNDCYFQTSKDNIYWVRNGSMSLVGNDTYLNPANGLNIADKKNIQLTTWGGATVNEDGSITNNSGNSGHPKIIIDNEGKYNPGDPYGSAFAGGPGDIEIAQWVGNKEYTALTRNQGFTVHLNDGNNNSKFSIQKDNKVGFYVGGGDGGEEIRIAGYGPIKLQGRNIDDGFDDGITHSLGNLQVDNLHVRKWLGVDQSKNAIVKTSQGSVTINAYETAEYYFGDIGEGQTSTDGIAYIGIEKLFNETVNTSIPYQVFITAYGPGNVWVEQRKQDRFMVKSSQPNIKFGWEIKAKRKGYEHMRLQNVDSTLNHMEATS